jgi:hypothetical protein
VGTKIWLETARLASIRPPVVSWSGVGYVCTLFALWTGLRDDGNGRNDIERRSRPPSANVLDQPSARTNARVSGLRRCAHFAPGGQARSPGVRVRTPRSCGDASVCSVRRTYRYGSSARLASVAFACVRTPRRRVSRPEPEEDVAVDRRRGDVARVPARHVRADEQGEH